jgi:hypothetical protein
MSYDEKKTIEATKKPDTKKPEDSKEELSEAELDQVAGGASRPPHPAGDGGSDANY